MSIVFPSNGRQRLAVQLSSMRGATTDLAPGAVVRDVVQVAITLNGHETLCRKCCKRILWRETSWTEERRGEVMWIASL